MLAAGWSSIAWAAIREYRSSGEIKNIYRYYKNKIYEGDITLREIRDLIINTFSGL